MLQLLGAASAVGVGGAGAASAQSADADEWSFPDPSPPSDGPGRVSALPGYIENPLMFAENREPTHVTAAIPYESAEAARRADEPFTPVEDRFAESQYVRLLNGEWDFRFYTRPADRPDSYDGVTD